MTHDAIFVRDGSVWRDGVQATLPALAGGELRAQQHQLSADGLTVVSAVKDSTAYYGTDDVAIDNPWFGDFWAERPVILVFLRHFG